MNTPITNPNKRVASAHGRFQPFHKGHLEYLLAAKQNCDFLWVGVTQFITSTLANSETNNHREKPEDNPLTYFERVNMIRSVLLENGLHRDDFDIIPFPIETPELLCDFLPLSIPIYTTVYEEWNKKKIEILRAQGYKVRVLWERSQKQYEGADIRRKIRNSDISWKKLVPDATSTAIESLDLKNRMVTLTYSEG